MDYEARCAFVIAQATCANAKIAAMQAENQKYQQQGCPPKYGYDDFMNIEREFMIGHNDVIGYLRDMHK